MRLSNPAVNLQKLGKYTISGFAKSAIADYYATLCVLQCFPLQMHTRRKGFLMRDRNNGVGHPFL